MRLTWCFFLCVAPALAALPPGYEEELYCRKGWCVQASRREFPSGFSGPRSMFHECCDELHPANRTRPRSWGVLVGPKYRAELLAAGYHTTECAADSECAAVLGRKGAVVVTAQMVDEKIGVILGLLG